MINLKKYTMYSLIVFVVFIFVMLQIATWSVFGGLISEEKLDVFMEKHLESYVLSNYDKGGNLFFADSLPFIAKAGGLSLISKWYIGDDYGRVPRWSKWSKVLDEKRAFLKPLMKSKTPLNDL